MSTTTETKHTPGPWAVTAFVRERCADAPTGLRAVIVSTDAPSAESFLVSAANASVADIARRGGLADARLIAAAPDMLEALQAFVTQATKLSGFAVYDPFVGAILAARAAIAKAQGVQSMSPRYKTCAVCGSDAGRWNQHSNRDTGYGICVKCVAWLRGRGMDEAELANLYGTEGVHWGLGGDFRADRRCPDSEPAHDPGGCPTCA